MTLTSIYDYIIRVSQNAANLVLNNKDITFNAVFS